MSRTKVSRALVGATLFASALVSPQVVTAAATSWNAFNDFYVNVAASGGAGNFQQTDWINLSGSIPFDTGLTTPNAWGYAGGNFNGIGAPSAVGTYVSGGNFYPLTSGNTYAGPGASYLLGGQDFWIGYNDQYGTVTGGALPNAQTQIGKYTKEWFSGSPNFANNPNGTNDKYLWIQSTGLSPSTNGLGAMLTWTAPTTATYSFSGSYVNGNYGPSTDFAIVDSTNTVLLAKTTLAPSSSVASFSFDRELSAGDVLQFQMGVQAAAQSSPLGLAVSVVQVIPEPSSIALASVAAGSILLLRRRRR